MTDPDIQDSIKEIEDCIEIINKLMSKLHEKNVEIRIAYKDSTNGAPGGIPCLDLWRAIEHVNYLKKENE